MTTVSVDRIQGLSGSIAIKVPCRVATTAAITASGLQDIDGVTVVESDRVLRKDETDKTLNGIWIASSGTWSRAADFDGANDIVLGTFFRIGVGTVSAGLFYGLTTANPIVIGTSDIEFSEVIFGVGYMLKADNLAGLANVGTAQTNLGATTVGKAVFTAATVSAAQQALDLEVGVDVQAFDADTTKNDVANVFTSSQTLGAGATLIFEATTDDDYEGILTCADITTSDKTWTLPNKTGTVAMTSDIVVSGVTLGTVVATTSGTSIDFTGIPAGTKIIYISGVGISTNNTSPLFIRIGDSGGVETTGYVSGSGKMAATVNYQASTAGFLLSGDGSDGAADLMSFQATLVLENPATFTWTYKSVMALAGTAELNVGGGSKALSAELTTVRLTTIAGTATFDAGEVNIAYQ